MIKADIDRLGICIRTPIENLIAFGVGKCTAHAEGFANIR